MPKKKSTRKRKILTEKEVTYGLTYGHNYRRTKKSRDVDNAESANLTTNLGEYWVKPNRNDWAGIDTVVRKKPSGFTKKRGMMAFEKLEGLLGDSGFNLGGRRK